MKKYNVFTTNRNSVQASTSSNHVRQSSKHSPLHSLVNFSMDEEKNSTSSSDIYSVMSSKFDEKLQNIIVNHRHGDESMENIGEHYRSRGDGSFGLSPSNIRHKNIKDQTKIAVDRRLIVNSSNDQNQIGAQRQPISGNQSFTTVIGRCGTSRASGGTSNIDCCNDKGTNNNNKDSNNKIDNIGIGEQLMQNEYNISPTKLTSMNTFSISDSLYEHSMHIPMDNSYQNSEIFNRSSTIIHNIQDHEPQEDSLHLKRSPPLPVKATSSPNIMYYRANQHQRQPFPKFVFDDSPNHFIKNKNIQQEQQKFSNNIKSSQDNQQISHLISTNTTTPIPSIGPDKYCEMTSNMATTLNNHHNFHNSHSYHDDHFYYNQTQFAAQQHSNHHQHHQMYNKLDQSSILRRVVSDTSNNPKSSSLDVNTPLSINEDNNYAINDHNTNNANCNAANSDMNCNFSSLSTCPNTNGSTNGVRHQQSQIITPFVSLNTNNNDNVAPPVSTMHIHNSSKTSSSNQNHESSTNRHLSYNQLTPTAMMTTTNCQNMNETTKSSIRPAFHPTKNQPLMDYSSFGVIGTESVDSSSISNKGLMSNGDKLRVGFMYSVNSNLSALTFTTHRLYSLLQSMISLLENEFVLEKALSILNRSNYHSKMKHSNSLNEMKYDSIVEDIHSLGSNLSAKSNTSTDIQSNHSIGNNTSPIELSSNISSDDVSDSLIQKSQSQPQLKLNNTHQVDVTTTSDNPNKTNGSFYYSFDVKNINALIKSRLKFINGIKTSFYTRRAHIQNECIGKLDNFAAVDIIQDSYSDIKNQSKLIGKEADEKILHLIREKLNELNKQGFTYSTIKVSVSLLIDEHQNMELLYDLVENTQSPLQSLNTDNSKSSSKLASNQTNHTNSSFISRSNRTSSSSISKSLLSKLTQQNQHRWNTGDWETLPSSARETKALFSRSSQPSFHRMTTHINSLATKKTLDSQDNESSNGFCTSKKQNNLPPSDARSQISVNSKSIKSVIPSKFSVQEMHTVRKLSRRFMPFPSEVVNLLTLALEKNGVYPDTKMRRELADKCGITFSQVTSWFSNRRSRFRKRKNKCDDSESQTSLIVPLSNCDNSALGSTISATVSSCSASTLPNNSELDSKLSPMKSMGDNLKGLTSKTADTSLNTSFDSFDQSNNVPLNQSFSFNDSSRNQLNNITGSSSGQFNIKESHSTLSDDRFVNYTEHHYALMKN